MKKNIAIFLDRDGVLNKLIIRGGKAQAPYTMEELELFPDVFEACNTFKELGFLNIVVTNQPDVARGWVNLESVEMINNEIKNILPLDEIFVCLHSEKDSCNCRKPMPGMLLEAAIKWNINLEDSFMIGDRYSDIAAGKKAGCKTLLMGPGESNVNLNDVPEPNFRVTSLSQASFIISSEMKRK